jgi:hypothetical protein
MSTTETPQEAVTPPDTGMRLHEGDDWKVPADTDADGYHRTFEYRRAGHEVALATLRRVGWLDQKGRVWLKVPPGSQFDGGSLTPLLIDARGD